MLNSLFSLFSILLHNRTTSMPFLHSSWHDLIFLCILKAQRRRRSILPLRDKYASSSVKILLESLEVILFWLEDSTLRIHRAIWHQTSLSAGIDRSIRLSLMYCSVPCETRIDMLRISPWKSSASPVAFSLPTGIVRVAIVPPTVHCTCQVEVLTLNEANPCRVQNWEHYSSHQSPSCRSVCAVTAIKLSKCEIAICDFCHAL